MSNIPFSKKIANFAYEKFAKNMGSFLLWAGIVGWSASCFSQTVAIIFNDKISKKEKKFLIPQEISDGIVNTLLFAFFTSSFTKFGKNLVTSGKLATKGLAEAYKTTEINGKSIESLIENSLSKKGKDKFNLGEIVDKIDPAQKGLGEKYWKFADGVSFTFSTLGALISCDVVTPFARNKIASYRQKASLEKDEIKGNSILPTPTVLHAQNKLSIDDYKKQAKLNAPYLNMNSSLKI